MHSRSTASNRRIGKSDYLSSRGSHVSPLAEVARLWILLVFFVAAITRGASAADAASSVTGYVSNAATGNLLEGARVSLPGLGFTALTDRAGRYTIAGFPPGKHVLVASYTGLDDSRQEITSSASQRVLANFELTTGVYQMEAFKVAGEREGNAAAITAQRNAPNLKTVLATDSYGNLPNMNAGELAALMPGVAAGVADEGNVGGINVRGTGAGSSTITIDGALMSSQGGISRQTILTPINSTMFEQLEITKGHTPDKGMDSLGGTINLKSRSPLGMKDKRRVNYTFSGRIAPSFTEQIPLREKHRMHPLGNLSYQEVFDLFGGEKNLGVSVNLFYTEQAIGFFRSDRDFQNTTSTPAYLWDYKTMDNYNNRKQSAVSAKFEYRLSPFTKVTFNTIYNDAFERVRQQYSVRAYAAQTVGTTGNAGILPGYTDRITRVRAAVGSTIDVQSTMFNYNNSLRNFDLGAEHEFGALEIDYNAMFSRTHINGGGGEGGNLINRITNVGWILDRTDSDLYPRFTQTEGPDFTNPANYRPASLVFSDAHNNHEVKEARANARYKLPLAFPAFFKTGMRWREEMAKDVNLSRRYNFIGNAALPTDPTIVTFDMVKTGRRIPYWNADAISVGRRPVDVAAWREDLYYREQIQYTGTRSVTETVTAGYVMAEAKFRGTTLVTGVRTERTEDDSWGWVRARIPSTVAQQVADPIGSAQRDYANTRRELQGSYTKSFPSVHLSRDISPNLKARLSWSTSFGRPSMLNLLPNETVNESAQTLTINNPNLLPQAAENWDATLDYYFEPVGVISVGWFHKEIQDYILTNVIAGTVPTGADNGYNGEYGGFGIRTSTNGGTAIVQGWEFAYQQQLTFLPGLLKGLALSANCTVLDTHGTFTGTAYLSNGQLPNFIPRTTNLSVSWRYRAFSVRAIANRTSSYITSYSAATLGRNLYRFERSVVNLGLAYQLRPAVSIICDVANLFNEPQKLYRGIPDQVSSTISNGTTLSLGLSGRF